MEMCIRDSHYSMSSKIEQKKWCATYSRCINALAEYQHSGNVTLYLVMDKRVYTFCLLYTSMPADIQLSGMEVSLVNAMSRETILRQYLDTLKGQYSHILIDCQPSLK